MAPQPSRGSPLSLSVGAGAEVAAGVSATSGTHYRKTLAIGPPGRGNVRDTAGYARMGGQWGLQEGIKTRARHEKIIIHEPLIAPEFCRSLPPPMRGPVGRCLDWQRAALSQRHRRRCRPAGPGRAAGLFRPLSGEATERERAGWSACIQAPLASAAPPPQRPLKWCRRFVRRGTLAALLRPRHRRS